MTRPISNLIAAGLKQAIDELTETMGDIECRRMRDRIAFHILDFRAVHRALQDEQPQKEGAFPWSA